MEKLPNGSAWEMNVFGRSASQSVAPPNIPIADAFTKVIATQKEVFGWNIKRPQTKIARELLECVKSYLDPLQAECVGLYCAIGSELDFYYGIDCFVMSTRTGKFVTIDLTTQVAKKDYAANLIFRPCDAQSRLWRTAKEIADRLKVTNR